MEEEGVEGVGGDVVFKGVGGAVGFHGHLDNVMVAKVV